MHICIYAQTHTIMFLWSAWLSMLFGLCVALCGAHVCVCAYFFLPTKPTGINPQAPWQLPTPSPLMNSHCVHTLSSVAGTEWEATGRLTIFFTCAHWDGDVFLLCVCVSFFLKKKKIIVNASSSSAFCTHPTLLSLSHSRSLSLSRSMFYLSSSVFPL